MKSDLLTNFFHILTYTHTQRSLWWQFYCVWFSHAELCGPLPRAAHRGCDPETHDPDRMCHDHDVTVSSNHWCFWWWWWWFQAYMSSHGFAPTSVLTKSMWLVTGLNLCCLKLEHPTLFMPASCVFMGLRHLEVTLRLFFVCIVMWIQDKCIRNITVLVSYFC